MCVCVKCACVHVRESEGQTGVELVGMACTGVEPVVGLSLIHI